MATVYPNNLRCIAININVKVEVNFIKFDSKAFLACLGLLVLEYPKHGAFNIEILYFVKLS